MNPTLAQAETAVMETANKIANQSDRVLFILALIVILYCAWFMLKYCLKKLEEQGSQILAITKQYSVDSESNTNAMNLLAGEVSKNTRVLDETNDVLKEYKRKIGIAVSIFVTSILVGCGSFKILTAGDQASQNWKLTARSAAMGGSYFWLRDHPDDVAKFVRVSKELNAMVGKEIIIQDFLDVAKQLPVKELRNDSAVVFISETVAALADGRDVIGNEKIQLYLKPIVEGVALGLEAGVSKFQKFTTN